jgi:hypothetical protein
VTPDDYAEDEIGWRIMVAVAGEVERQLRDAVLLPEDGVRIIPGAVVVVPDPGDSGSDRCERMAWVRLIDSSPTRDFPNPHPGAVECGVDFQVNLEVGAVFCSPITGADGEAAPTAAEWRESAREQMAYMAALRRALTCVEGLDVALGNYFPMGPQGGLTGGAWQARFALGESDY